MNNFFQSLAPLLSGQDLTITLRGGASSMTVSVLPKSTSDAHELKLSPILITGTAEEIDGAFMEAVCKPIEQVREVLTNTVAFHESVKAEEDAAKKKKSKSETKKADASKKVTSTKSEKQSTSAQNTTTTTNTSSTPQIDLFQSVSSHTTSVAPTSAAVDDNDTASNDDNDE